MLYHCIIIGAIIYIIIGCIFYKHKKKKTFYQAILDFIKLNIFTVIIALIIIECIYISSGDIGQTVDLTILGTVVIDFFVNRIGVWVGAYLKNRLEDSTKLSTNYKGLVKQYGGSQKSFLDINHQITKEHKGAGAKGSDHKEYRIPVIEDYSCDEFDAIEINDDNDKTYSVSSSNPATEMIADYKDELFKAHDSSNVYNQLNIRVDDWRVEDRKLCISTSRTTYYASLLTNRAMDYVMQNECSVRDILQPGPFVPDLKDSQLSNHLGFNAFIVSKDLQIPFIKRNGIVSIGKRTYGASVSASVKAKYKHLRQPL